MVARAFLSFALFLVLYAPANAGREADCRRRCGSDDACYRRCMGSSAHQGWGGNYYGWPRWHHNYWRKGPSKSKPVEEARPPVDAKPPKIGAEPPSPVEAPKESKATPPETRSSKGPPPREPKASIVQTAYDFLYKEGGEAKGYGLYSYLIIPHPGPRGVALLQDILSRFPSAEGKPAEKNRLNVLFIPVKDVSKGKIDLPPEVGEVAAGDFLTQHYDFSKAQRLLAHLCDQPAPAVAEICQHDLSSGPYLLTYGAPISQVTPLPPPFLFVDLTLVRPRAFPLYVEAFAEQVKRPDFTDGERLNAFYDTLANILLTAADWVDPVSKAAADLLHFEPEKPKEEQR